MLGRAAVVWLCCCDCGLGKESGTHGTCKREHGVRRPAPTAHNTTGPAPPLVIFHSFMIAPLRSKRAPASQPAHLDAVAQQVHGPVAIRERAPAQGQAGGPAALLLHLGPEQRRRVVGLRAPQHDERGAHVVLVERGRSGVALGRRVVAVARVAGRQQLLVVPRVLVDVLHVLPRRALLGFLLLVLLPLSLGRRPAQAEEAATASSLCVLE
jgi:hypothetical protein